MVSEPVLWPPPPPVVAGKSFHQTLTEMRAILELHLLKHETTVYNYAKQFEEILPYALISKSRAINLFILGLQPNIRKVVQDFNPNSLDIAISRAYLHEMYGKKVNQESKNADNKGVFSQNDNVAVRDRAQNNEIDAEAMGTLKDDDEGEHEGMADLEVHDTDSQEDGIQTAKYGRHEQTESKILNNADPERIKDESDTGLNLTADAVEETYEIHDLNVEEADNVAANVKLINDVIVEDQKCGRIKNWSKTPTQYDLLHREGDGGFHRSNFLSFPRRRFFFANRLLHFQPIQGLHKKVDVRAPEFISPSAVLRSDELHSVGQPPPLVMLSLKSCPAAVHTVIPEAVKSALSSLLEAGRFAMENVDTPEDAKEHCPGPQSESIGKSDACEGCLNQQICATAPKGPDKDLVSIAERLADVNHKILVLSGKWGVGESTFPAQLTFALDYLREKAPEMLKLIACSEVFDSSGGGAARMTLEKGAQSLMAMDYVTANRGGATLFFLVRCRIKGAPRVNFTWQQSEVYCTDTLLGWGLDLDSSLVYGFEGLWIDVWHIVAEV